MNREEVFRTVKAFLNAYEANETSTAKLENLDPEFVSEFRELFPRYFNAEGELTVRAAWDFIYRLNATFRPRIYVVPSGHYKGHIAVHVGLYMMARTTTLVRFGENQMPFRTEEISARIETFNNRYIDGPPLPKLKFQKSSTRNSRVLTTESLQDMKTWRNGTFGIMFDWLDENGIEYELRKLPGDVSFTIYVLTGKDKP
jgi:hypothetical protein